MIYAQTRHLGNHGADAGTDRRLVCSPEKHPKVTTPLPIVFNGASKRTEGTLRIMPQKNSDLHGNAPDKSLVAVLLIDVINDLDFPEAEQLLKSALPMARQIAALKKRAKAEAVPVVYANDNFGRWRSDLHAQTEHCLNDGVPGRPLVELLRPEKDDYFILKPKHSGFFSTTLDTLLEYLGVKTVILTGIATNICVLFTANDAYMRDLHLVVPGDCVAANTEEEHRYALAQMAKILKADVRPSHSISFAHLKTQAGERSTV
jgi:nicotinamidase-related amidase